MTYPIRSRFLLVPAAFALLALVGCKQEATTSTSSASTSVPTPTVQSPSETVPPVPPCTVTSISGGAQIKCGDSEAIIANGGVAPKRPVLIDGSSGSGDTAERVIGDHLISVTKNNSAELITVWIESEDAILQYENGIVYPRDRAIFFQTTDCTGDAFYQTNSSAPSVGMGDRIVYWDAYYRIESTPVGCMALSKKEKNGSCTEIPGSDHVQFVGFAAKPASPGVTTVLSNGYRVKMR